MNNMKEQELIEKIRNYNDEVKLLMLSLQKKKEHLKNLKDEYAKLICPFEVGQIIENYGFAYNGKKMKITKVAYPRYEIQSFGNYEVFGNLVKQDGTVGKRVLSFYQGDYEK